MPKPKPLRILDPIHGLIQFDVQPFHAQFAHLINTSVMQRLRDVRQLGLAEFVYPGATHSRFSHSLGVAFVTQKMLRRLSVRAAFDPEREKQILVAALLHDIGHGPFSHTFEQVEETGSHVDVGRSLLDDAELQQALAEMGITDRQAIADLWSADAGTGDQAASIISGALDADRLDYLRRDQLMSGNHQGQFDWPWLLDNLVWCKDKGLMLSQRSLHAAEAFLMVRAHLYQSVYFHRTVRGAEWLLVLLLRRYRAFCQSGEATRLSSENHFQRWFSLSPQQRTSPDFLSLTDHATHRLLGDLAVSDDARLSEYARRLQQRKFWHCHEADKNTFDRLWPKLQTPEMRAHFEQETGVCVDYLEFSAYSAKAPIWLQDTQGASVDLASVSPVARALREPSCYLRFYYDDEDAIKRVLQYS